MDKKLFTDLTEEQKKLLKNCRSREELNTLLAKEHIQLTMDQLDAVNGGCCFDECPEYTKAYDCNRKYDP